MTTYISLTNELLRRLNEVPLDSGGDGFDSVRNVQALAKDAINNSIRSILQDGQEWPFLKTTYVQPLSVGTRQYSFPSDMSTVDWETFYLKKLASAENQPRKLSTISFEQYTASFRPIDDNVDPLVGSSAPQYVYQTYGTSFGVTPVPNDQYEVEYVYWSYPADLSLFDDVTIIPNRFKHVIIDGAMMYLMRFRSNEQSAAVHENSFQNGIKTMRRILLDDKLSLVSTVINRSAVNG
tara:strand:+ start:3617 stop:4327 length:711 start_codon:yes stop_codon:yes gene_type:complete